MRISDKLKLIKKAKQIKTTFKTINESDDTFAGMKLMRFVQMIRKNPESTIELMTDEEFIMLFGDEQNRKTLFMAIPKLEKIYLESKKQRNI